MISNKEQNTVDARNTDAEKTILVLGATGKTGRRIVAHLESRGVPVRIGSRSAVPAFDWNHEAGWDACLEGVKAVYVNYVPDLAVPGATDAIRAFVDTAVRQGVERLVLISGRGEEEAQACERIVQESGLEWTVVRASWFDQNFSEGAFVDMIRAGQITLPSGSTPEPWIDVDDIAEVAAVALTEPGHHGEVYEVTGPRLMTLHDLAADLSAALGRKIVYTEIPHQAFVEGMRASGAPQEVVWLMDYLFSTVLDGRNSHLADGVERALGRPPRDFADFAREVVASSDVWKIAS